jgi:hypothetical protein
MVVGGFAQELRDRVWGTLEAVEGKAAESATLIQVDHGPQKAEKWLWHDELGGDAVQPGTTNSLYPCGGRGRSNTT